VVVSLTAAGSEDSPLLLCLISSGLVSFYGKRATKQLVQLGCEKNIIISAEVEMPFHPKSKTTLQTTPTILPSEML
jgi:hypothetical protein